MSIEKPHQKAYSVALQQFRLNQVMHPEEILMIGDTPETDIRSAYHCGMASALIMETGIMADRISHKGLKKALLELLTRDIPTYLIARFVYEDQ